ncbi:MAG: LPS assembly lipoprotein LptE [Aureispira sp.]
MAKYTILKTLLCLLLAQSCTISLINRSIDYDVLKTFNIDQFGVKASNAPPIIGQQFSEQLKLRVLNNTKLAYVQEERDGDVLFSGDIVGYNIEALAPQADQSAALQRLTIKIDIEYKSPPIKDGSKDWRQTFSRFANFSAEQDLATVETQLITEIYDQIMDDVFNKAFSGW